MGTRPALEGGVGSALGDRELARIPELVARHDRPGPRYTSYPTAPVWSERFGEAELREALAEVRDRPLSIYVHVPFCERLCAFCACTREIAQDRAVVDPYLDALEREAELLARAIGGARASVQLALGGGSPNFVPAAGLARLLRIVDDHFPPEPGAERSVELDPRGTQPEQLEVLAERGLNRASVGVQDTDPEVQHEIRRFQTFAETQSLVERLRALGVGSVSFDLVYGLPRQTLASFERTLSQVLELRPDRLALYSYAHVTWVSKAQRGLEMRGLPAPEEKLALFVLAIRRLEAAGYRFLGLDHFALPDDALARAAARGDLQRNFMGYSVRAGVDLIALGPSGISETAGAYAQSQRSSAEWQAALQRGRLATLRGWRLSEDDVRRKWLIQRLMCQGEVAGSLYRERFGEELEARIPGIGARLQAFARDGLLEPSSRDDQRVTPLGRLFLRPIAMAFDAYLAPAKSPHESPRFSRAL
jgi:oxygen-independent coproporphyrinogen-3 oxidase